MTRRNLFDPTLIGTDLAQRGNAVYRQMLDFDWPQFTADFERAMDTLQTLVEAADGNTADRVEVATSDISDGTWKLAAARAPHMGQLSDTVAQLIEALAHVRLAQRTVGTVKRVAGAVELEQARDASRCYVKPEFRIAGVLPWYRPDCEELILWDTPWGGLCGPCYQRAYRWAKKQREKAA